MTELVVLNLGRGSLHTGFLGVSISIYGNNEFDTRQCESHLVGSLPAAPQLQNLYYRWQLLYESLYRLRQISVREDDDDGLEIDESDITHVSESDFNYICSELQKTLNKWLDTEEFRPLERQIRSRFDPNQEIRIVIQTEDNIIPKLPWFSWQFLQDYSRSEVAFSGLNFATGTQVHLQRKKCRILAILGDSTGIDVERDRALLESLPDAEIAFLVEPQRQQFNDYLWEEQGWDILFFAGHSRTHPEGMTGRIDINPEEDLTIEELNHGLKRAIAQGLQLAIFNSCDGLGLAQQLTVVNIPQTIVMKEPVSDRVAETFLTYFLTAYAQGNSLLVSVREARERLQGLEGDFPGASWLPVMFQNPAAIPLRWGRSPSPVLTHSPTHQKIQQGLLISGIVTLLVMGMRWLGMLQPLELSGYDVLMRLRPSEPPSEELLLITIDTEDMTFQDQQDYLREGSLADEALAQLLAKLQPYQPSVIGLDIYRNPPIIDPDAQTKVTQWEAEQLIYICQIGGRGGEAEVLPPPNVDLDQVGFSDLPLDPDLVIRRQILGMAPGTPDGCYTSESFSFLLAKHYLATKGIEPQRLDQNTFKIGDGYFEKVEPPVGGYQKLDAGGFEVLLNYYNGEEIAPTIPLRKVLDGSMNEELSALVRDRVVLIGNIDRSFKDYHQTPFSRGSQGIEEVAGLEIQAHATAAIISAALGKRPSLWWLPQWGDLFWVWGWSLTVSSIALLLKFRLVTLIIIGTSSIALLTVTCWLVLSTVGGWLPFVPALLAISLSLASIVIFSSKLSPPSNPPKIGG